MSDSRRETLIKNWEMIKNYCKENYANKVGYTHEFIWKHEVYGWKTFGIDNSGNCWLTLGSHGYGASEWLGHPEKGTSEYLYRFKLEKILEEVCTDWPIIKDKLENIVNKESNINNFHV